MLGKALTYRLGACAFVAIATLVPLAVRPAVSRGATPTITAAEQQEVSLINGFREQNGLKALKIDPILTTDAMWMSRDLAVNNIFSHTDSEGRDPFQRMSDYGYPSNTWRGENLAAGNADPEATLEQWENSPDHRANMLNANYTVIGIGYFEDASSEYDSYWATEFGSQLTSSASSGSTGTGSFESTTPAKPKAPAKPVVKTTRPKAKPKPPTLSQQAHRCATYSRKSTTFRKLGCTNVLKRYARAVASARAAKARALAAARARKHA